MCGFYAGESKELQWVQILTDMSEEWVQIKEWVQLLTDMKLMGRP